MMNKYHLLLLFLVTSESKIQINLKTSHYLNKTIIEYQGSNTKQVTENEIALFNITNENLNRGIRIEMGKVPDELFLKDPTVYGDVFKKFKWPEVKRKLSVRAVTVEEFVKEDVVLKRIEDINNTTASINVRNDVVEPVTNTVATIWNKGGLPDDTIMYNVFIDFGYGSVNHQINWRDNTTTTFDLDMKISKGVLNLQSGQSIVSKLLAEKIILLVEIEFYAHLIGNVVANYAHTYGKYHLWSPTIGNIMRAAKLKNEVTTKMLLEVRYYANAKLEIKDKDTGEEIAVEKMRTHRRRKQKYNFS